MIETFDSVDEDDEYVEGDEDDDLFAHILKKDNEEDNFGHLPKNEDETFRA